MEMVGPVFSLFGYFYLSQFPIIMSGIMRFAAGGFLYAFFKDIAPNIGVKNFGLPPLGGILGFLVGIIGHMLEG